MSKPIFVVTDIEEFKEVFGRFTSINIEIPSIRTKDGYVTDNGKKVTQPRYSRYSNLKDLTLYEKYALVSENNRMKAAIDSAWRTLNTI